MGDYFFDKDRMIIAKGISSIKYMGSKIAEELHDVANRKKCNCFTDVLYAIGETNVNTRQLDILIKIDFFSEFGNQRELLRITDLYYNLFKSGSAKKIARDVVVGTPVENIISKYAIGIKKDGSEAKSYTLLDIQSAMREIEEQILSLGLEDLSDIDKVKNFEEAMGYAGYASGKEEDRRKLYITDKYELCRKKDGKQFGYSVITKSIGSGVESRFTVFNGVYAKNPIKKGDIIYCEDWKRDGQYFTMLKYRKIS